MSDPDLLRLDLDGQTVDVARRPDGGMSVTVYVWGISKVVEVPGAAWGRLKAFVDKRS